VCFIKCSLFGISGAGYHTLVGLWPAVDCHLAVHSLSKYSLSSFLIELLAVNPHPSTKELLPPALASFGVAKDSYVGLKPF
jgi:hypothetical protein